MEILNAIDINLLIGVLITIGLTLYLYFAKGKVNFYDEMKLAILISGTVIRDDKVTKMSNIVLNIVKTLENMDKSNAEKKNEAIKQATEEINKELGIILNPLLIDTIIEVAVSHLPKTNK